MFQLIASTNHNWKISGGFIVVILVLAIWQFIWKGIALWKAVEHRQVGWFVALLVLNTLGVLEILYIVFFQASSKPKS